MPTFQHLKGKVLTCQYLFLLEEITHFMQCFPLKERNVWLKCLLSEVENGFDEAYSSKPALKGCHGGDEDNHEDVCAVKPL